MTDRRQPKEEPMAADHHCSLWRIIVIVTIKVKVILKRR
jgi:hypothetical protein